MTVLESIRRGPTLLGWSAIPLLMRGGAILSVLFAGVWLLFVPFAAFNLGSYSINDQQVTGQYFLLHAYPILAPFVAILLAIAYGYWTERLWARPLPLIFWFAVDLVLLYEVVAGLVSTVEAGTYAMWAVLYLLAAWWYCYRKGTVVQYYQALTRATASATAGA